MLATDRVVPAPDHYPYANDPIDQKEDETQPEPKASEVGTLM